MTAILGISAYYHDSAAALAVNGEIVAAAQQERFSRCKHDSDFPSDAVDYCLKTAGIAAKELTAVAFYERPAWKFGRLVETHLASAPKQFCSFESAMSTWLSWKLGLASKLRKELGLRRGFPITFCDHHRCHAASAFRVSPFRDAAIVTIDAVGEWTTTAIHSGTPSGIETLRTLPFPHSLGLLYSACTSFAGFEVNDGEYKLMGLAPLGEPKFVNVIRDNLINVKDDGSFHVNTRFVDVLSETTLVTSQLESLLGAPARQSGEAIRAIDRDLAASIQVVTDDIVQRIYEHAKQITGQQQVCFAGGVALNCASLGQLLKVTASTDVWVQPAAGDAGCAIGAALEVASQFEDHNHSPALPCNDRLHGGKHFDPRLGPAFTDQDIQSELDRIGLRYEHFTDEDVLLNATAQLIADGNIVGWFQDRMEFGPRALGSRSILADPRRADMQSILNSRIKHREDFRPFAPAVLRSKAADWFEIEPEDELPWMNFVVPVQPDRRANIPSVTHTDSTARVQTVGESMGRFHRLLETFDAMTSCPILINTSFNDAGEPIVCTPRDAARCFLVTQLDALVIGSFVVQPPESDADRERLLSAFDLANVVPEQQPSLFRQFQNRVQRLFKPLNLVISRITLLLFYFGVFFPVGIITRGLGYDPLGQRISPDSPSDWVESGSAQPQASSRIGIVGEFVTFLREEKKWWLAPILVICVLLMLLVAASASPVAPFVYTLF